VDEAVGPYLADHARLAGALPGAEVGWLRSVRDRAVARLAESGFPGPRDEAWKYTRVGSALKRHFTPSSRPSDALRAADIERLLFAGLECDRLVFVNGWHAPQLSSAGRLPEGAVLGSLAQVLGESPELVRPWIQAAADRLTSGFDALNLAFLSDGAWLYLARGVVLERPVHLLFVSTGAGAPTSAHLRNLIVAGPNSQARVIESYVSIGAPETLTTVCTDVVLDEGANLEHYRLQDEAPSAIHIARLEARQGRRGQLTSHSVSFGAGLARNDIRAVLDAEGAECTLNGLYMVDGRQHVDFHTSVEHVEPRGTSREFFKGILGGRARGVFNGRVHVHPGAQKTDSEQANKNLLLSRDAEVDTKPELEIYADDVKCSHGATVGQLDPDMLFYLRARGIDELAARGLLTYGFAQDVVERMSLEAVRHRLEELLLTRVPAADYVKAIV
jgi:Fe-S cluster assembly protein SufD